MSGLQFTPNMQRLLEEAVDSLNATIIIISDSNSEFINHILKERGLSNRVDKVFTNPASWSKENKLEIQPYHHQETCTLGCFSNDTLKEKKKATQYTTGGTKEEYIQKERVI